MNHISIKKKKLYEKEEGRLTGEETGPSRPSRGLGSYSEGGGSHGSALSRATARTGSARAGPLWLCVQGRLGWAWVTAELATVTATAVSSLCVLGQGTSPSVPQSSSSVKWV